MMRFFHPGRSVLAVTVVSFLLAACSAHAPVRNDTHRATTTAPPASHPPHGKHLHAGVIDDTYVIAPKIAGRLRLRKTHNYQTGATTAAPPFDAHSKNPFGVPTKHVLMGGVQLRYGMALVPISIYADLFVYPSGGGNLQQHLRRKIVSLRKGMQEMVRRGVYKNMHVGHINHVMAQGRHGTWPGLMFPMHYMENDMPVHSRTYLFIHHDYFYEFRIDKPRGEAFAHLDQQFIDGMAKAVEVVSVGTCGHHDHLVILKQGEKMPRGYIAGVSPDGENMTLRAQLLKSHPQQAKAVVEREEAKARQLQVRHGCVSLRYTPPRSNLLRSVLHLHYPPDVFRSRPRHKSSPH